jgi:hypothetical protein
MISCKFFETSENETAGSDSLGQSYDVSPDGQRFLMIKETDVGGGQQINLVLNWFEELKRLVPTDN